MDRAKFNLGMCSVTYSNRYWTFLSTLTLDTVLAATVFSHHSLFLLLVSLFIFGDSWLHTWNLMQHEVIVNLLSLECCVLLVEKVTRNCVQYGQVKERNQTISCRPTALCRHIRSNVCLHKAVCMFAVSATISLPRYILINRNNGLYQWPHYSYLPFMPAVLRNWKWLFFIVQATFGNMSNSLPFSSPTQVWTQ